MHMCIWIKYYYLVIIINIIIIIIIIIIINIIMAVQQFAWVAWAWETRPLKQGTNMLRLSK